MSSPTPTITTVPEPPGSEQALLKALSRLLGPLARLCVAHGVTFAAAEEMLKQAFVREADVLQPGAQAHGTISRISNATGIRRREVARLMKSGGSEINPRPPLATQVFARWTADPALRDGNGATLPLKRQGEAPSFETLAQSVTRDVHPRSLLEELLRLGFATYDEESGCVNLVRSQYVPGADSGQMLGFLADNVGDHFDAAVTNVLHAGGQHFEQAVFADELSAESAEALRPLVTAQWQAFRDALVPALVSFIEADAAAGRTQNQRVRIGLYSFSESISDSGAPP